MKKVKNFLLWCAADDRDTEANIGPRGDNGGFKSVIYMRNEGLPFIACRIQGKREDDGLVLELIVYHPDGKQEKLEVRSKR